MRKPPPARGKSSHYPANAGLILFCAGAKAADRIALVIGNTAYQQLGQLPNASTDARAIADILREMGYETRLVEDAGEQVLRREVREFARNSDKASIAIFFYAGHGAQVNGQNYLLPIDMDAPRKESDIELTALKVDDLVNSVRSATKVVFLDACRDNPVLFKNLVSGRGAHSAGLAPTVASNLAPARGGGGVFIAYATDSGSVAADGAGEHSPFTQALMRNLQKPISIDDMFSLVTREVRLVTKEAQRPYKYASLDGIVCLTGTCRTAAPVELDAIQQAQRSEAEELQVALQTRKPDVLETYLQKHPDSPRRTDIIRILSAMRRVEFEEWTLFATSKNPDTNQIFPFFAKLNTIEQIDGNVAVTIRNGTDSTFVHQAIGHLPTGGFEEDRVLYDCKNLAGRTSESTVTNSSGDVLWRHKWADPKFLAMIIDPTPIAPNTPAYEAQRIFCDEELRTPMVQKADLAAKRGSFFASTPAGDGDMYYYPTVFDTRQPEKRRAVMVIYYPSNIKFADIPLDIPLPGPQYYRTIAFLDEIDCGARKWLAIKGEYYDANANLVAIIAQERTRLLSSDIVEKSPLGILHHLVCHEDGEK